MSFSHEWLIEKRLIQGRISGVQTVEELMESNAKLVELLDDAVGYPVHIIINDDGLREVPASLFQTRKVLTYTGHQNLGWVVIYGNEEQSLAKSIREYMYTTLAKLARARYTRVNTFEEAIDHLKTVDSSIDWEQLKLTSLF